MYNRLFCMSCLPYYSYRSAASRNPQSVQFGQPIQPTQPTQPTQLTHSQSLDNSPYVQEQQKSSCDLPPANEVLIKSSAMGGIILPEFTDKNATYNVASLNLDTYSYRDFFIHFNFTCNIVTTGSRMHLRFQLFKQGKDTTVQTPVSSSQVYSRYEVSGESNTFSFIAYDRDSMGCRCCNYSVFVQIMGFETMGTITITNPVLIASIIENNSEIV
ncbi:hypothetical protein Closa_1712 [[Clostridium] saccharolyticum WM1]|uniref:DUF4489 domain-containing protein n=2 Tax=Lacrimispora TaxID=2719231 RepID=D9QZ57_LACSW|nr:DUF4489 domain-containing protein [Lacrimispora saccharolytica]ADL04308.1 hypothetical protein Closa_1712 [[Clostridium] saccharolyticum WM1]